MNNSDTLSGGADSTLAGWGSESRLAVYFLTGLLLIPLIQVISAQVFGIKAQAVGHRFFLEPQWLVRLRYIKGSAPMINYGYEKFKEGMFKVRRQDGDLLVISQKYVDQLRSLPEKQLSSTWAHCRNLHGPYTTMDAIKESTLHIRVIQQKLTPNLASHIPVMEEELKFALEAELPKCDDEWVSIPLYEKLVAIITRMSNRIFVGDICRNDEWNKASIHYAEDIGMTTMLLRMVPAFTHPVAALMLPSYWRIRKHQATAERLLGPVIRERQARGKEEVGTPDLLQYMMNLATPEEQDPDFLARRQLLVSFGALHTTAMAGTHTLYDLVAHPEYMEPLREEIKAACEGQDKLSNQAILQLVKFDSFMKESQRHNPPSLLGFHRYVRGNPLKLSDGTVLPVGTHFAMASDAVLHDTSKLPGGGDPYDFDGFRYSRLREDPENQNRYLFAQTDNNHLHFGHGRCACPGRFLTSVELKVLFVYLLSRYDFKYPEGEGRPENLVAEESRLPHQTARVFIRRRKESIV
ncbi:cytochrome P450 monooxygenase [Stachybotrys elegans]|uniref:Cytochrome P450 monooxygenase n=1 Tax=Stachybotrys elegans TaxID=80388 RepID=A0A8K0SI12_9HYPO|nr:cytochrome P450 monooxygenase [Stachybotrys elegans]